MHKYQQLMIRNHSLRNVCSVPCRYDRTQSTHHAKHCLHSVAECPTKFPPVTKNKSLIYVLVTKPLVAYCCAWIEISTEQIQQPRKEETESLEFQS
ncbi:hypothetical protein BDZ91DRAFT_734581 [Kalaharituber pfeilii]|nr:hypothetical protein BDZ91DRAFT_734581 [Kalaharituber pfeilii]